MGGENHLIYRPPLTKYGKQLHASIRTIYSDNKWLNEPQFVGSFDVGQHVLFFFREIAHDNSFGERIIHSRVARVCKKDIGGRNVLRQVWTSFVKARLNCSVSANYPFYFAHIREFFCLLVFDKTLPSKSSWNVQLEIENICYFSILFKNNYYIFRICKTSRQTWRNILLRHIQYIWNCIHFICNLYVPVVFN